MPKVLVGAGMLAVIAGLAAVALYVFRGELVRDRRGGRQVPALVPPTAAYVARLRVPDGFRINVFAAALGGPRVLAVDRDGTVLVTRPGSGDVIRLEDPDNDGVSDSRSTVIDGLDGVHGLALHRGRIFLSTVHDVFRVDLGRPDRAPVRVIGDLPDAGFHPSRMLGVGPDGRLYVSIGSACNACVEKNPENASIVRVGLDGSGRAIFATGLRDTIGFGWHPQTGEMWGMDHGADWLGDDVPPEELNRLVEGAHYGWPFVYGRDQDVEGIRRPWGFDLEAFRENATAATLEYQAHAAPIQMVFYTGASFPAEYAGDAFVAMRGSWNRRPPTGYEVVRIRFRDGRPTAFEPFLTGFLLDPDTTFARPAGVAVARDGSLLVGDDANGVIYRVSYAGR